MQLQNPSRCNGSLYSQKILHQIGLCMCSRTETTGGPRPLLPTKTAKSLQTSGMEERRLQGLREARAERQRVFYPCFRVPRWKARVYGSTRLETCLTVILNPSPTSMRFMERIRHPPSARIEGYLRLTLMRMSHGNDDLQRSSSPLCVSIVQCRTVMRLCGTSAVMGNILKMYLRIVYHLEVKLPLHSFQAPSTQPLRQYQWASSGREDDGADGGDDERKKGPAYLHG